MLELTGIDMTQGSFRLRVDLSLAAGQGLGIMGVSGSGKSTLLSVLAGFSVPDAGRIKMDGRDVTDLPVAARPVSIMFQDNNLFPHLDVFDNVALGIAPSLRLSQAERARVDDSLVQVGLDGFGPRKPANLSGGQQSRVALARMLVRARPIALLDEPFAALDPGLRHEMVALVERTCRAAGQTVIMVTHDMDDVAKICDRVLLLKAGTVALDTSVQQALADRPPALAPWL